MQPVGEWTGRGLLAVQQQAELLKSVEAAATAAVHCRFVAADCIAAGEQRLRRQLQHVVGVLQSERVDSLLEKGC